MRLTRPKYGLRAMFVAVGVVAVLLWIYLMLWTYRIDHSSPFTSLMRTQGDATEFVRECEEHLHDVGFSSSEGPDWLASQTRSHEKWFRRESAYVRVWYHDRIVAAEVFQQVRVHLLFGERRGASQVDAISSDLLRFQQDYAGSKP
jgi:hypothetical protein